MWSTIYLQELLYRLCANSSRAKVVDPADRKKILPVGARGELALSGYLVMKGYWSDPDRTAEVLVPDDRGKFWMHVGNNV
jgi:acyl-CoA synthetase (AMP-forming)/AMP-acid ligase II